MTESPRRTVPRTIRWTTRQGAPQDVPVGELREATYLGVVGVALGLVAARIPSFWTDEVATVSAAGRTWPQLWDLLGTVDAVHGAYYVVMHVWIQVVGISPFALRAPSAIACGVATAGVYVLGRRLVGRGTGVLAAMVFVVLPGVTWMGIEARSFALVTATTVWCAVLLVTSLERGGRRWIAYSVLLAVSVLLFVQTIALVLAHAITVLSVRPGRQRAREWTLSAAAPLVALSPFILLTLRQRRQVEWIAPVTMGSIRSVLSYQWFQGAIVLGALTLLLAAAVVVFPRWAVGAWSGHRVALARLAIPWLVVPTAVVLGVSILFSPMYVPRYLTYTAPAIALLAGAALATVRRRWTVVLVLALVGTAAPTYAQQRSQFSKDTSDWSAAAEVVAGSARAGDAVIFVPDGGEGRSPRRALDGYPSEFAGLTDLGIVTRGTDVGALWNSGRSVTESADRLAAGERLWLLGSRARFGNELDAALRVLAEDGYAVRTVWSGPTTTVLLVTARPPG